MALTSRVRPRPGDVVEVETPKGFAYAQYTHKHATNGALIRVLQGLFGSRPTNFAEIVQRPEQFLLFFPLGAACNRGIVRVVAEEEIPASAQTFPLFRSGSADAQGEVKVWFLWDGVREWRVDRLTPEQKKLPLRPGVWNDTLLIERIVSGWRPSETDLIVKR
jgi:hypothetical protein